MKAVPLGKVKGILMHSNGPDSGAIFRIYQPDHSFTDYEICHYDMSIEIDDPDVWVYTQDGQKFLDHSPATLGRDDEGNPLPRKTK